MQYYWSLFDKRTNEFKLSCYNQPSIDAAIQQHYAYNIMPITLENKIDILKVWENCWRILMPTENPIEELMRTSSVPSRIHMMKAKILFMQMWLSPEERLIKQKNMYYKNKDAQHITFEQYLNSYLYHKDIDLTYNNRLML
jgi:hypothetical protein